MSHTALYAQPDDLQCDSIVADEYCALVNSRGDITHVQVDAIVNAANTGLLGAPLNFFFRFGLASYSFPVSVPTAIKFLGLKINNCARYRWRWR